jgi:hypothetical protein
LRLDESSAATVIDYRHKENRVLCEQLGGRRLRFTDDQRHRLATIVKPKTLLA